MEVIQIAKRSATVQWCLASSYLQHRVSVDEEKWVKPATILNNFEIINEFIIKLVCRVEYKKIVLDDKIYKNIY